MKYLIPFVLLLAGCAPRLDYTFSVSSEATDEHYNAALAASREWNGCNIVHITVERGGTGIPVVPVNKSRIAPFAGLEHAFNDNPEYILFDNSRPYDETVSTLAHEFGHAIGIIHHTPTGLMRFDDKYGEVTTSECQLLWAVKHGEVDE